jgi:hypothetical protein
LHLGPCIRALCAPHWNSFLPSSPEARHSASTGARGLY